VCGLFQIAVAGAATFTAPATAASAPDDCPWLARHAPAYTVYVVCLATPRARLPEAHPNGPKARTEVQESPDSGPWQPTQETNR